MKKYPVIGLLLGLSVYAFLAIGCGSGGSGGGGGGSTTPSVVSQSPTIDATGVSLTATLEITFSEPMLTNVTTVSVKFVSGEHTAGWPVGTLTFSWSNNNKTLRVTGITTWSAGTGKIVSIVASRETIRSAQGVALPENSVLWKYTLAGTSHNLTNMFMLHHSVGRNLLDEGAVQTTVIPNYNTAHGTNYLLWDHEYNLPGGQGLRDPNGTPTGQDYAIPSDNTDPDGLEYIFTSSNADAVYTRTLIMSHEVIILKSCFPNANMPDDATLTTIENYFLSMRNYFDAHTEKLFIVMGIPPLHRLVSGIDDANRARARSFANWLKTTYVSGHPNVVCFDLFDYLAASTTSGSDVADALKYDYEQDHSSDDSHPNATANGIVGPLFGLYIINAAQNY